MAISFVYIYLFSDCFACTVMSRYVIILNVVKKCYMTLVFGTVFVLLLPSDELK